MTTEPQSVRDNALPDEVIRLLDDPAHPDGRAVHHLLTVDDHGRPHATLSSANQWWTGPGRLVCVLDAGRTSHNLSQRPQSLLLVVGTSQVYSIRVSSTAIKEVTDHRVVVVFDVVSVESDTRGVTLTPMLFEATDELIGREQISQNTVSLAAQLAQGREAAK